MPKIQVRRGLEVNLPALDIAEPGFTTDTKRAFFGSDEGNVELAKKAELGDLSTLPTGLQENLAFAVKSMYDSMTEINVCTPPYNLKGDGTDEHDILQELFNLARDNGNVSLFFPKGRYGNGSYIRLYANTFVRMHSQAEFVRLGTVNKVFINGELNNDNYVPTGGYNGEGNIHFIGGGIDLNQSTLPLTTTLSAFDLGHGENISFVDFTIRNGQIGHYFQVSGCNKVLFERCTIKDQVYTGTGTTYSYECIQMEPISKKSFPSFGSSDDTVTKNVIIDKCNFNNVIRALGTHSYVSKATTTGSITAGATALTVADASNFNAGESIKIIGAGADTNGNQTDLTTTISSKSGTTLTLAVAASFTVTSTNVSNQKDINVPAQYCENIKVTNCTIDTTTDTAISLMGYKNTKVVNNTIVNTTGFAISMNGVEDSELRDNTAVNIQKSAVNMSYSNGNKFSKNIFKEIAIGTGSYAGIRITDCDNNTFDDDTITSVSPNYTWAWYSSGGSVGNKIISHRYTKGKNATIAGADSTEMDNYQVGSGQDVLFDGDLSTAGNVGTLLHDARNYNFLVILGNDNGSATAQLISMVLPKSALIIGTTSRFRLICDDSNASDRVDFSFPTGTSIQVDAVAGIGHIRKVIGVI